MAHSRKKATELIASQVKQLDYEIEEISAETSSVCRRIRDITEDDEQVGFETIDQQIEYTVSFFADLIDYLEEMHNELQQLRMFAQIANNRRSQLLKKIQ